ncbi:metalloproteinase [Pseudoalteromonas sp. DL2-H2.2]|uniref:imelysin family protein n=1 Tax=Pseudoalteromonas sp. DL2-H2.2 TaxID=2908889 RepID=UPI001F345382|nr:imelysin family protein [Pseudoalteromonas sp. DL2-H2.2]MCF2906773.1 metalloproteinase [Pseudoalteromonas sp. DL2-H2.2]
MKAKKMKSLAFSLVCAAVLAACNGDDGAIGPQGQQGVQGEQGLQGSQGVQGEQGEAGQDGVANKVTALDVVITNARHAYAVYADSLIRAKELQSKIDKLVAMPSQENFTAAKLAWLNAREPYGQSEVYRFREGPIDALTKNEQNEFVLVDEQGPEGAINAWPLAEAMIDYTITMGADNEARGDDPIYQPGGNIIADAASFPSITKELLRSQFEINDESANVSTGYHAIEFLLWGQDLNQDGTYTHERDYTAGHRAVSDYYTTANTQGLGDLVGTGTCTSGEAGAANDICTRRGAYLKAAAELLVDDLQSVVDAWTPGSGFHYEDYIKEENATANLTAMLESMGRLSYGELAGERMSIAVRTDSQEDEHSCFSDNTHRDILLNAKGVENHFFGQYTRIDGEQLLGAGIDDLLVSEGHAELANELRVALEKSSTAISVIDTNAKLGTSFDVQIQMDKHKAEVYAAVDALAKQTEVIQKALDALGLNADDSLVGDTDEDI